MEIQRLKDNGVTTLTFWGHVTSSVTWPFDLQRATSYGWSIVTNDHVSILHRYGDMALQTLHRRTDAQVILYRLMLCIALDRQ